MSQAGPLASASSVITTVVTLTADSGGAVPPDAAGNIDIFGNGGTGIVTVGNPGLNTITIFADQATTTQRGTIETATNAEAAAQVTTTAALTPSNITSMFSTNPLPVNQGGTGDNFFTPYAVITGGTSTTNPLQSVATLGTAGQVLTSNGAGMLPTFQTNASGDVVGPAVATDNAAVRFDGTTGKLIQNSVVIIDDTGIIFTPTNVYIGTQVPTNNAELSIQKAVAGNIGSYTFNSDAAGGARDVLQTNGTGDAFQVFSIFSVSDWAIGLDNSDSDKFKISANSTLGTADAITIDIGTQDVTIPNGDLSVTRSDSGATVFTLIENTSNTASSNSELNVVVGGTSAGDPYTQYAVAATSFYALGIDNSASDSLKLNFDTSPVSPSSGTTFLSFTTAGVPAFPAAPLGIASGGTNATSMATTDGVVYYDGTRLVTTSAGTSGQVLTSNGAGVAPTYQANAAITQTNIQVFAASGTYTPTSGMKYCIIELVGGGGGGGGAVTGGAGTAAVGAGGGAGGYARSTFSAATIGASQTVTCGAGGTAGANTGGTGGTGGTTSVGALISATGGVGGTGSAVAAAFISVSGGAGGAGTGTSTSNGAPGGPCLGQNIAGSNYFIMTGFGGNSRLGTGGQNITTNAGASAAGNNGSQGGGGSGAYSNGNNGAQAGGVGGVGYVVITEFI